MIQDSKDSKSDEFQPLECINQLELTSGSTAENSPVVKKYQQEIKEAMDLVMKKATEMIDQKITTVVSDQEQQRSLQEVNFKAKINELRRDILLMSVKHECFQKQTLDMMRQNQKLGSMAVTSDLSKQLDCTDKSTQQDSLAQKGGSINLTDQNNPESSSFNMIHEVNENLDLSHLEQESNQIMETIAHMDQKNKERRQSQEQIRHKSISRQRRLSIMNHQHLPSYAESNFPQLNKVEVNVNTSNFKSMNVGGSTTDMKKEQQSSFQVKYEVKPKDEKSSTDASRPTKSKSPDVLRQTKSKSPERKKYHQTCHHRRVDSEEYNSLVGVLDNSTFKMFQTSEKTTTVKVNCARGSGSNERHFRRRSRNMKFKPTLEDNKKSIISTNKIYLATTHNTSPKNYASTSISSPLEQCDQKRNSKVSQTQSSTHLFHYGGRSIDSRANQKQEKTHKKQQHSEQLLDNIKRSIQQQRILNVNLAQVPQNQTQSYQQNSKQMINNTECPTINYYQSFEGSTSTPQKNQLDLLNNTKDQNSKQNGKQSKYASYQM